MAAGTKVINEIINITKVDDQTAAGAASAAKNLDAVSESAERTEGSLSVLGDAGASAARAIAESTGNTASSMQEMAAKSAVSITALRRSLRELQQQETELQGKLDAATSAGANADGLVADLGRVQTEISSTTSEIGTLKTQQQAASRAALELSGDFSQATADTRGYAQAMVQAGAGTQGFFSTLRAGSDTSLKATLRDMRSMGDELASVVLKEQAAQEKLSRLQVSLPEQVATGKIRPEDADAALATAQATVAAYGQQATAIRRARQETEQHTKSVKLEGYQIQQVADEAHKFFDMVAAGGSPLKAAFYEVPNAVGIMGGMSNSLAVVRGLLTGPTGIALGAAAAGAALVGLGAHAEEEEAKLARLGTQLRGIRSDASSMADTVTSAAKGMEDQPGWDKTTSRQAAVAIGSTYNFTGNATDITSLSGIARDYGSVFGTLEDGLNAVTTAMKDPTAEVQALYKQHLPGVDAGLVEQVHRLQEAGEQGKAYALVIGAIKTATQGAHENGLTPFQRALENLEKTTSPLTQGIEDVALAMGTKLLNSITGLLGMIPQVERSNGGLVGSNGQKVLDNYAAGVHHYGLMQVADNDSHGRDLSSAGDNIEAGILIFQEKLKQAGGNLDNALALYSGNAVGSSNAKAYANRVYRANLQSLPKDTDYLIKQKSDKLGLSDGMANIIRGIVLKESSGYQYDQHTKSATPTSADHAASAAVIDNSRSLQAQADSSSLSLDGSTSAKLADLQAQQAKLEKLIAAPGVSSDRLKQYNEQLEQTRHEIAETLTPQQKITDGLRQQLTPLQAQSGYWREMASVQAQFSEQARGNSVDQTELLTAQKIRQQQLAVAYEDGTVAAQHQAASQKAIAQAAGRSNAELQHAINYQQAYNEALQDFDPDSAAFANAIKQRVAALDAASDAQQRLQTAQQNSGLRDNLAVIRAESASIGQNADQRQIMLATMQAELQMHRQYGDVLPQEAQDYIALTGTVAQASAEYQHHEQVLSDVTGSISSMTDTLTNGLTQGFLQGTSSGMSFKNVLSGIETQIAGLAIKLGLINPLLNEIDGGTRSTLSDVNKLFSGSSSDSGSGGFSQYLGGSKAGITSSGDVVGSSGLTVKDAQAFFGSGTTAGSGGAVQHSGSPSNAGVSSVGQVISNSGWAGNIGQISAGGAAQSGTAGIGQAVGGSGWAFTGGQSLDSTAQTLGGSGVSSSVNSGFGSMSDMFSGNGGLMSSSGMSSAGTMSGAMGLAGGAFGGLTTGYSVGKKASNLTGGGKGGKIGAAVGAGIGTAVGAVFGGPIGAMIGGAVLGTVGGVIGGLFNKKHYVYDSVVGSDGQLSIGGSRTKHASDDVRDGLQTDLDTVNSVYSDAGITVSAGDYGEVGHYHKGKKRSSTSLSDLLGGVDLSSDKANENLALKQIMPKKFDSISDYTQAVESIVQLTDTLDALHVSVSKFDDATHVTVGNITGYTGDVQKVLSGLNGKEISTSALQSEISTVKELVGVTAGNAESLVDQVADLRDKYAQAADQAKRYGLDYQVILDKGNAIAQQMLAAEATKLTQADQSVQARYLAAIGDQAGSDLVNFDVSAAQQRQQLSDEWQSYLGDSYASNADYSAQMLDLDKTLAAERLKIQNTYSEQSLANQKQAQQSLSSTFNNLRDYAQGLSLSDASPLSVSDQYKVANDNLQTDYGKALGGDSTALASVQKDMQSFLSISEKLNGGGIGYVTDYKQIQTMLQSLGSMNTDKLTADAMRLIVQDSTTTLATILQQILQAVAKNTTELRFQSAKAAA
ncbi:phage tail protein [Acetobacter sp.]|uniref:phage tail protein n=1 Tax=Acetobacter sp. TaxID=440 RepID=UPI0039EBB997